MWGKLLLLKLKNQITITFYIRICSKLATMSENNISPTQIDTKLYIRLARFYNNDRSDFQTTIFIAIHILFNPLPDRHLVFHKSDWGSEIQL